MSVPTLLDIAKLDAGIGYPLIEEAVKMAPELTVVPADTMTGTTMELTVRTGLPSVRFRNANDPLKIVIVTDRTQLEQQMRNTAKLAGEKIIGVFRERVNVKPGETVAMSPDLSLVHLFDAKTGNRIS